MALYVNELGEYWNGSSIIIDGIRYISPSEEILLLAGYHVYVPPALTEEELLELAKEDKIMEIEDYDLSSAVNIFYLGGQPMWLDAATRLTLRISIESYLAMGLQTATKWFDGNEYTFPTQMWLTMLNALEVYAAEALNITEAHKAAVNALTTIQDVEDFDITVGYPEPLNLTPEWLALHT